MRAPGIAETRAFYEDMWGLTVAHSAEGLVLLRGTGPEPFLYGLRNDTVYGIDYVHFAMPDRASMDSLHAQVVNAGTEVLGRPALFDDFAGGYGFFCMDPDRRRLRFSAPMHAMLDAAEALAASAQGDACRAQHARHGGAAVLLRGGARLSRQRLFRQPDGVPALHVGSSFGGDQRAHILPSTTSPSRWAPSTNSCAASDA